MRVLVSYGRARMRQEQSDFIQKKDLKKVELPSEEAKRLGQENISLSKFTKHTRNPFVHSLSREGFSYSFKHTRELDGQYAVDIETGVVNGSLGLSVKKRVDRRAFVKLYGATLTGLMQLTPAANRVLLAVLNAVQYESKDTDRINLNQALVNEMIEKARSEFMDEQPEGTRVPSQLKSISKATYFRAMAELVAHDFLAPCTISPTLWFINPAYFYNGNTLALIQQYEITDDPNSPYSREEPQSLPQGDFGELEGSPYDENE